MRNRKSSSSFLQVRKFWQLLLLPPVLMLFAALHVSKAKQQSGTIVIQTGEKNGGRKEIPFNANVLQG